MRRRPSARPRNRSPTARTRRGSASPSRRPRRWRGPPATGTGRIAAGKAQAQARAQGWSPGRTGSHGWGSSRRGLLPLRCAVCAGSGGSRRGGGDADTLAGLPDAPFDDAATRHLVWTPTDPPAAFAAWFRVLKPGARLLASTRFAVSAEKPPAGQPRRRSRHRTMFQFLCAAGMPGMPPGRPTSVPPVALAR